jgi:hypothetical protein
LGFEAFFQAEYPGFVRALYLLTGDQDEAEELAQATLARVYERWERVRVMDSPAGYVYRAAVNLHRQRRRHLAVRARRLLAMAVHVESTQPPGPGGRLVLAGDQELWVVDVAGGTVRHRRLPQLSPWDPPYRIVRRGDKLVLWSYQTLTLDPNSATTPGSSSPLLSLTGLGRDPGPDEPGNRAPPGSRPRGGGRRPGHRR